MSAATAHSLSEPRRMALKAADQEGGTGVPLVSNFFPIDRYYNAAEKLYDAFGKAYEDRRLDDAYVYGFRFAEFSVEGLPKHDYYRSKKYESERRRNTVQVKEVIAKMEAVVQFMDEEELVKQRELRQRQEEAMRREQEAMRREQEKEQQRFDALQDRISKMKGRRSSMVSSESVESSALSKLEMLRQPEAPKATPSHSTSSGVGGDSERRKERSSSRDDGRSSSGRRGSGNDDNHSIRRSASGSSDDNSTSRDSHRRSRRTAVHNNGPSHEEHHHGDSHKHNGHRRSTMSHSPPPPSSSSSTTGRRSSGGSSDDDTGGGSSRRSAARPPSSSSSSHKVSSSERSNTLRSTSSHSANGSSSRVRSKSPSILIDNDQQPLPPPSNSWSQAPDPKDAWKLEKDDDEPVSSRFRENFPANRHVSSNINHSSHGSSTPTPTMTPASAAALLSKTNTLPPPLLPPPPPPSYNQVVSALKTDAPSVSGRFRANQYFGPNSGGMSVGPDFSMNNSINRPFAAPAGGAKRLINEPGVVLPSRRSSVNGSTDTSVVTPATQPARPTKPAERVPIRKLRDAYASDYRRAQQDGWIEIRPVDTYQGRLRQSTNGCTVISPLVVAHHLRNSAGGVLDAEIIDVIDKECGPLLREIRSKLGLEGDSLIIPSDVHDHLVDRKILQQNKFYGATGGNIMDRDHIWEFLKLLQAEDKGAYNKAGACLFFHEHVVSLVKMPIGRGKVVYDLVDSMPSSNHGGRATRTRCRDLAALEILLRWYSTRKFSESECTYIDRNDWDENMADFDPRVFQSFVWTE